MNYYLKIFFMMYLSLFTFISKGITQENSFENIDDVVNSCTDYILNVYPSYSEGLNFVDGTEAVMAEGTIRLELVFSLHTSAGEVFQARGIGESNHLNETAFGNLSFIDIEMQILDVVREAVRDGYEGLKEVLGERQHQLRSVVRQIEADTVSLPLGQSHYIQVGDVFNIYRGGRRYNDYCDVFRHSGPRLATATATATVIGTNNEESILKIVDVTNESRPVQVGDVVELDPSVDLVSRRPGQQGVNVALRAGLMPDVFIGFREEDTTAEDTTAEDTTAIRFAHDVTHQVRRFLVKEAFDFGFQLFL